MTHCVLCGILFEPLNKDQKICDCCQDDLDECNLYWPARKEEAENDK